MSKSSHGDTEQTALRQQFRAARRALSAAEQQAAAQQLAVHFSRSAAFHHASSLAFYLAADGELSLAPLLEAALAAGKRCFLPVANAEANSLSFCAFHGDPAELAPNRWGILEPTAAHDHIDVAALDLVFLPLVACDAHGTRLGMGKGFYDRALGFLLEAGASAEPRLVGVAHDCQVSATPLPRASWDVPLTLIATPTTVLVTPA
ncbi:MAG: 5-formyltetrahydrofolate cyclo-ligase [Gammaproteobacteria bacterium]|jgi:5-formyltetrahydrofolate cyclo-ligase|nr:5-formyltetrahydrofolate cyclo-ligase [Gammaproteobacteria bacterium]